MVWSYILEFENGQNPYEIRKSTIAGWRDVAIEMVMQNEQLIKLAENFNVLGIKSKDSLHLACAVWSGSDYFITTDKKLLNFKIKSETKIIGPIDFVIEMEG